MTPASLLAGACASSAPAPLRLPRPLLRRRRLESLGLRVRPALLDVLRGIRRLAVGVAVVDLDLADALGGGERGLAQTGAAAADRDHRHVHAFAIGVGR